MKKIPIGILGASGTVGQQYIQLLSDHPWFEIAFITSSESTTGKKYSQAISGKDRFTKKIPDSLLNMTVCSSADIEKAKQCPFVFSALPNEEAKIYEETYAKNDIAVISNASYHRMNPDIPLLIPEVNPEHVKILEIQQKNRGFKKGFIIVKPNCSLQSYMIPLAPLHRTFKIKRLIITTMQAVSGAGYPGVSSLDIIDNVVPHIPQEEEKSEKEPLKIWGTLGQEGIMSADTIEISAHCNRVPVMDGHMACVSVEFEKKPLRDEILKLWEEFPSLNLPTAPPKAIIYRQESNRPQPRHDRDAGLGMSITVGRLRECPVFDYRFVALSHNTIRGAAGGGILNAEFLKEKGYFSSL